MPRPHRNIPPPDYAPSYENRLTALLLKLAWLKIAKPHFLSMFYWLSFPSLFKRGRFMPRPCLLRISIIRLLHVKEATLFSACDAASSSQMNPRTCTFGLSLVIFALCPAYDQSCIILRMQAQPCLASVTSFSLASSLTAAGKPKKKEKLIFWAAWRNPLPTSIYLSHGTNRS